MKIYLITDTHLGHGKMVEFCGRPSNHTEIILKNLQAIPFENNSILVHLGDICIGNDSHWNEELLSATSYFTKILVRGNHDKKSDNWYLDQGWDFVCERFDNTYFGKKIAFTHKPIADDGSFDLNIHGHFHNSDHRRHEPELKAIACDKHKLLAIEYTSYKPVLLKTFLNL